MKKLENLNGILIKIISFNIDVDEFFIDIFIPLSMHYLHSLFEHILCK